MILCLRSEIYDECMHTTPGIEWIERALAHLPSWRSARNKGLGALTIALTFVLLSNASQEAHAAPASAHTCAANVGFGGLASGTLALTKAGDGCAVIKYTSGGTTPNGGTFTTGGSYSAASNTGSLVLLEPNHSAMLGKR